LSKPLSTSVEPANVKLLTKAMRRMLIAASILVFAAGIPLFLLSSRTETTFAWTIKPSLTAAFLGAGYWGSFVLEFLAAREGVWARARGAVAPVLTFTVLTLVATLIHLGKFHFHSSSTGARFSTWGWLVVYAIVPPVMTALLVRQIRIPGVDPPREAPLPMMLRLVLAAQAVVMLLVGALLFVAPSTTKGLWPWALTPLTARAVAAWLLGIGLAAGWVVFENDRRRVRILMISYAAIGVLELVALLRYLDDVDWGVQAGVFLLFAVSMPLIGAYGWRAGPVTEYAPAQ
jgi:hypothetical protein